MERDTTALYTTLGIDKTASGDEIKKAYRRLALRYHPDKNPGASTEEYLKIVHAYEILSDARKRSVYDRYGEFGVSALDTPMGQLFDPEVEGLLCVFFTLVTLVISILIIFLAFLSVRIDGITNWRFVIIFIPLWIVDILVISVQVRQVLETMSSKLDRLLDREFPTDNEEEAEDGAGRERKASNANRKRARKIYIRLTAILGLIYTLLLIAFQVLIALKADKTVNLSAVEVFIPYFAIEGLNFFSNLVGFFMRISDIRSTLGFLSFLEALFSNFWLWDIRVAQAILIALRIDEMIHVSWAIVFIPLYLIGFKYAVQLILAYRKYNRMEGELATQGKSIVVALGVIFLIFAALMYALVGLVALKLDGHATIPMSSILIPIFILLSMFMCCFCCCLPLVLFGSRNIGNLDDDEENLVDPNRRIVANNGGRS